MKNKILFLSIGVLLLTLISGCRDKDQLSQTVPDKAVHEDPEGYWTCPMHPQVHEHAKGQCPICGMNLVHVDPADTSLVTSRNEIRISDNQLSIVAIGRYTVSRKDFDVSLSVSGSILSPTEVGLQIYETDLAFVEMGSQFFGFASSAPQDLLAGKIQKMGSVLDPTTRTLKVFGIFENSLKNNIMDGGFHGKIVSKIKDQIVIPEDAVLHTGTRDLVYRIATDNQIQPVAVILGKKSAEEYQVLGGLKAGDVISTGPNFLLDSESKIRGGHDQTSH